MKEVVIHTDGACSGNPGPGGWGVVLVYNGQQKELSDGAADTTNNRMELMAAIKALEALKEPCKVVVWTDSKYVQEGITYWIRKWRANGWKNASGKQVKNVDLWQKLLAATRGHEITWRWLKGHAGHVENERCDQLARAALARYR